MRRLVIVGLDGQDPTLTERFMEEGHAPELPSSRRRAATAGCGRPFRRSRPWRGRRSAPARNPAQHNIFDFLDRDRRTYLPLLSSAHIGQRRRDSSSSGASASRCERPELRLLRKSKPFWTILGEHGIWSTVLRVPITFPPEKFDGAQLSAMCVPDLLGTQGTFLLYTTRPAGDALQGGRHPRRRATRTATASRRAVDGPGEPVASRAAAARECRCASRSIDPARTVRGRRRRRTA